MYEKIVNALKYLTENLSESGGVSTYISNLSQYQEAILVDLSAFSDAVARY